MLIGNTLPVIVSKFFFVQQNFLRRSFYVGNFKLCTDASFAAQSCCEREEPFHRKRCWMGDAVHELQPGHGT